VVLVASSGVRFASIYVLPLEAMGKLGALFLPLSALAAVGSLVIGVTALLRARRGAGGLGMAVAGLALGSLLTFLFAIWCLGLLLIPRALGG